MLPAGREGTGARSRTVPDPGQAHLHGRAGQSCSQHSLSGKLCPSTPRSQDQHRGPGPSGLLCWPQDGHLLHTREAGAIHTGGGSLHQPFSGGRKGRGSRDRSSRWPAALPGHLTSQQLGEHTRGPCAGRKMQTPRVRGECDTYRLTPFSTRGAWQLVHAPRVPMARSTRDARGA